MTEGTAILLQWQVVRILFGIVVRCKEKEVIFRIILQFKYRKSLLITCLIMEYYYIRID